jgi:hypothetical protein
VSTRSVINTQAVRLFSVLDGVMEYLLLKYLHILGFVYWLGGDLGTFLSSRYLVNRTIGNEARLVATKIMLACDQGPKLAMPMMFAIGLHLASLLGVLPLNT